MEKNQCFLLVWLHFLLVSASTWLLRLLTFFTDTSHELLRLSLKTNDQKFLRKFQAFITRVKLLRHPDSWTTDTRLSACISWQSLLDHLALVMLAKWTNHYYIYIFITCMYICVCYNFVPLETSNTLSKYWIQKPAISVIFLLKEQFMA